MCTLCAFLMRTRRVWLFSAHLLPLLARACCLPLDMVNTLASASMGISGVQVAVCLLSNMFVPYRLARAAYREIRVTNTGAGSMAWCLCKSTHRDSVYRRTPA